MILNVISSPKGGGAELLVRELLKIYTAHGFESQAIYLSGNLANLEKNEHVIGLNPKNLLNIICIRKILKLCFDESQTVLIVHAHLTWPFFYLALASLGLKRIKLIYTEHNTTNKRRKIPRFWLVERLIYARYSKVICISQGVHDSLARWVGSQLSRRLVTIPNGSRIYSVPERLPLKNRRPRLISVGSLTAKKNFATAVLEAHARGVPAISTRSAGYCAEFLTNVDSITRLAFDPLEVASDDFIQSVLKLIEHHEDYRAHCIEKASLFSEERVLGDICRGIQSLLTNANTQQANQR